MKLHTGEIFASVNRNPPFQVAAMDSIRKIPPREAGFPLVRPAGAGVDGYYNAGIENVVIVAEDTFPKSSFARSAMV